jgi:hypothetical protein
LRLVPLPLLPTQLRLSGNDVRECRWPSFRVGQGYGKSENCAIIELGIRRFCGECGTPFLMQVDHQPESVDFSVATLEKPEAVARASTSFRSSKVQWFEPKDHLPRHDKFRPNIRGLDGSDPPMA